MGFGDVEERHTSEDGELSLAAKVESLLFVADGPVPVGRLAEALETTPGQIEQALADLEGMTTGGGLRLQRAGSRVQLITAPETAPCVERFLGLESRTRLSRAALETLAIVAYRQPMTRPEIEAIRGVNSDSVLRTLLSVGLIEDVGRAPTVGRPILYGTTFEFLQHFGLRSMDELPPLDRAEGEEGVSSAAEESAPSLGEEGAPSAAEEGVPSLSEEGAPSAAEEGSSNEDA